MPKTLLFGLGRLLLAEHPRGGTMYGDSESIPHGEGLDFRSLLKDVEESYSNAFAELGPSALANLKRRIDSMKAFLGLSLDEGMDFRVKLIDYAKVRTDVFKFCRCYARRLAGPIMEKLKAETYEIVEDGPTIYIR